MQEHWIYLNNRLLLENVAVISPYDHGFLYGHGLFETMRVYHGRVFCLDEHLNRLNISSKILGWTEWFDKEYLSKAIYQTLEKNRLTEASIRLTISRGVGNSRPDPSSCSQPTIVVFASPIQPINQEVYAQGWSMATSNIRRNVSSPLCTIKTANYLDNILARVEAQQQGANDALLLNTLGSIAEGTLCNVFFVLQGRLITPDKSCGILPGITRAVVLELAHQAGITIEERQVYPDELDGLSEMFMTSSLLEIMPVTTLDQKKINDGLPGVMTRLLQAAYQNLVQSSCY
jgi:branched-chain amino acid aminotransferase